MYVLAGFDRVSDVASTQNDTVMTGGLGNCIAVVAYNQVAHEMVIAHYNTLNCFAQDDAGKLVCSADKLVEFRDWLNQRVDSDGYVVGLGAVWYDTAPKPGDDQYSPTDDMRFDLITQIDAVFNCEPAAAGLCIRFRVDAAQGPLMEGSMNNDWIEHEDPNWTTAGVEIPY